MNAVHPHLNAFYKRLRNNRKKTIVAIIAAMRKLIVIANAQPKAVQSII